MSRVPADRCKLPQAFWLAVKRAGVSPPALLRQARLPAIFHADAQRFISTAQWFALWKALEQLAPEPGLGLKLVQMTDTAVHPPAMLAAFHARDYRDALQRLARFKRLCTPERLDFAENGDECAISTDWLYASEPEPAIATDATFATLLELGRRGTGTHIVPKRVEFTRAKPRSDTIRDYFDCPIRYRAPRNVLVLKSADLARVFPGHNPELLEMLTPALAAALGELDAHSSVGAQVKAVLKRNMARGRPELSQIAEELGVSERTLQRRITDEGSTFRDLVVTARQELGRQLLSDPGADIDEVACLLGYQDASSFYRAFRDWEGVTPSRWRELNVPRPRGAAESSVH